MAETDPNPTETNNRSSLSRRTLLFSASRGTLLALAGSMLATVVSGCSARRGKVLLPERIWGRLGTSPGRLHKPRAIAINATDEIFLVDRLGRIQVYDLDGTYLRGWKPPAIEMGRPTGLAISSQKQLLVADTHYHRLLTYDFAGQLQEDRTIGGQFGYEPGQFHFVTDVVEDRRGHILAGQYGELDQIQEFDAQRNFVRRWGKHGNSQGDFDRPQCLIVDKDNILWVADSHNHCIKLFDLSDPGPRLVRTIGQFGTLPGQLHAPYGLVFDRDGTLLVAEHGNHRVQRFALDGRSLDVWGEPGAGPGQFYNPWAIDVDSRGAIHVVDTMNHRVQVFS